MPANQSCTRKSPTSGQSRIRFARPSAFARTLQQKLHAYTESTGQGRFADWAQWVQTGLIATVGCGAYVALLSRGVGGSTLSALGLVGISAFAAFMMLVTMGHDAAHGSISRFRRVNEIAVFLIFSTLGVSGSLWRDRHQRLHHAFPNVPGTGIDADGASVVRLAPDKPHRWYHRLQPLYAIPLYALGMVQLAWVEDFRDLPRMRRERPHQFGGTGPLLTFVGGKLFHLAIFVALPMLIGGFGLLQVLVGYGLAAAIVSLCFATLVIGTHVSDRAVFPEADAQGRLGHDWATHQLITSVDWAPTSRIAAALTGGANAHTAHHLFPGFSHCHAAHLSRIVIDAARQHGLDYRATSFAGMVAGHLRHIGQMSRPTHRGA